ncbi:MAG: type II pantothenate kinase [Clostridia bacterium]|nr:type II pantothenate kinase [Clostridia bacterium]
MGVVIGIDVGGSTTKIVGFDENKNLMAPFCVTANDPITSVYGALGKFTATNNLSLDDIEKIMITGVGSSFINKPIYNLKCERVPEFKCIGLGGLYLSDFKDAIIVSMGTGTALVHAVEGVAPEYLGGTGVGGGTLMGLSKKMLGLDTIQHIDEIAREGKLENVDLKVKDLSKKSAGLNAELTAANFGRVSDIASKNDIALGLINMVFETVGMMAVFAARQYGIKDIVFTGNLTNMSQTQSVVNMFNSCFDTNIIVPENAQYSTVIGAAISSFIK